MSSWPCSVVLQEKTHDDPEEGDIVGPPYEPYVRFWWEGRRLRITAVGVGRLALVFSPEVGSVRDTRGDGSDNATCSLVTIGSPFEQFNYHVVCGIWLDDGIANIVLEFPEDARVLAVFYEYAVDIDRNGEVHEERRSWQEAWFVGINSRIRYSTSLPIVQAREG